MYNPKKTKKKLSDFFQTASLLGNSISKRLLTFAQFHIYKEDTCCTGFLYHINDACGSSLFFAHIIYL